MARIEEAAPAGALSERLTYEQFLTRYDGRHAELVGGEVVLPLPVSERHADLARFLTTVLRLFVGQRRLGVVLAAPFQMKLGPDGPGREPDLLFVATAHLDRLAPTRLLGPADVAVEIVSPESVQRDWQEKFTEYARAGVREYWLFDPERQEAHFFQLGHDGQYHAALAEAATEFHSQAIPGFWLRLEWLWQAPLDEFAALRELGVIG